MSVTLEDTTRLFRVRRTVLQMLSHRGYTVVESELSMTFEAFKTFAGGETNPNIREKIQVVADLKEDTTQKILVFFGSPARLGIDDVRKFVGAMETAGANKGIVVAESVPTPRFNEQIAMFNAQGRISLQVFQDKELLVNITEHVLVPLHVPLTKAEVKELLAKYKLKLTQLPRIQPSDPVARYYGLSKGEVVKIIRQSETAGRYVTYRTVV